MTGKEYEYLYHGQILYSKTACEEPICLKFMVQNGGMWAVRYMEYDEAKQDYVEVGNYVYLRNKEIMRRFVIERT